MFMFATLTTLNFKEFAFHLIVKLGYIAHYTQWHYHCYKSIYARAHFVIHAWSVEHSVLEKPL